MLIAELDVHSVRQIHSLGMGLEKNVVFGSAAEAQASKLDMCPSVN